MQNSCTCKSFTCMCLSRRRQLISLSEYHLTDDIALHSKLLMTSPTQTTGLGLHGNLLVITHTSCRQSAFYQGAYFMPVCCRHIAQHAWPHPDSLLKGGRLQRSACWSCHLGPRRHHIPFGPVPHQQPVPWQERPHLLLVCCWLHRMRDHILHPV